ncbi:cytochrome P450 [Aspergillus avenaceus]|uniref:Cytochrome P450 n=1 Tax=Aspergillus avenaceus TaxID=36643 RepID=A0A5N6U0E2_ASPAV|nr:cytochrome P450 [Aspergillus avenaceus]
MAMNWFLGAIIGLLIYGFGLSIYRLWFHPLSKYPGPRLAALTRWYVAWYIYRGVFYRHVRDLHNQYGDVVRTGPDLIHFNSPATMVDIYGAQANVLKTDEFQVLNIAGSSTIFSAVKKNVHAFKRRTLLPLFNDRSLQPYSDRILRYIERYTSLLGQGTNLSNTSKGNWGPPIRLGEETFCLLYDITSDIALGQSLEMLTSPDWRFVPSLMLRISRRSGMGIAQPLLCKLGIGALMFVTSFAQMRSLVTHILHHVERRLSSSGTFTQKEMVSPMATAQDKNGFKYTTGDIASEITLLIFAGADTTASAMTNAYAYLLHHPSILSRLTDEIRSTFANVDEIRTGSKLTSCHLLYACLDETLRLMPVAANGSFRRVQRGGTKVGGDLIPAGTDISVSAYSLHRKASLFPSPDDFIPDRWLPGSENAVGRNGVPSDPHAFVPFSMGPRGCIGMKLSRMTMSIMLARVVFLYDLRWAPGPRCCHLKKPGQRCDELNKAYLFAHANEVKAQLRPRQT